MPKRDKGFTLRVEGDRELREYLERLGPRFTTAAGRATVEIAMDIERDAKSNAPVNFGQLRAGIRTQYAKAGLVADVGVHEGDDNAGHARHVHDGTRAAAGNPQGKFPPIERYTGREENLDLWVKRVLGGDVDPYVIARKVHEDGTKPNPFLANAYDKHAPRYADRLKWHLDRELDRSG